MQAWHVEQNHDKEGSCRWEMVECGAGAPELSGATLPQGMTGPELLRQQMDAAASHNLTVMRFWVPGVSPAYALQTSPGVYNEGMLQGITVTHSLQHVCWSWAGFARHQARAACFLRIS